MTFKEYAVMKKLLEGYVSLKRKSIGYQSDKDNLVKQAREVLDESQIVRK